MTGLTFIGTIILAPLLIPLFMMILGAAFGYTIAPYLAWMVEAGMWLLTKKWWWFPVGQIVGLIVAVTHSQ